MMRNVTSAVQHSLGVFALGGAFVLNTSSAYAAAPATAIAKGDCATAINAGDYAKITITCGLTAKERKVIDGLVVRTTTLYNSQQKLKRSDLQQTQSLQAHTNELASLKKELDDTKAMLAGVVIQVKELAAVPGATIDAKQAALALADGEVDPAIRLLGKRASVAQLASEPESTKAASELYAQQAVLLQTRDLNAAKQAADKALQLDPGSSLALGLSAQLAYATGDFATAIHQQQKVYDAAAARLAATPGNTVIQQEVAVARGALGWFRLMTGELVEAREDFAASLAGIENLVAQDKTNLEWRRLQGVGYSTQADGQLAVGDVQGALASIQLSHEIAKELVVRIGSPAARHDVVGRLQKIANIQSYVGEPTLARDSLESALEQLEPIITANPEVDAGYSDQVNILGQLAWLQATGGKSVTAIETFRKAVLISESRLKLAPLSSFWQRWVMLLNGGLGDALMSQPVTSPQDFAKITDAAEVNFNRASMLAKDLAAQAPQNPVWQNDLWMAISRLARVKVAQGRLQEALGLYESGLPILERIIANNDSNAFLHNALGAGYGLKADTLARQGRHKEATIMYGRSIDKLKRAHELAPAAVQFERDLATTLLFRGQLTYLTSPSEALLDFRENLRIRKALFARQPANGIWEAEMIFAELSFASALASRTERVATLMSARQQLQAYIQANRSPPFPNGTLEGIDSQIESLSSAP